MQSKKPFSKSKLYSFAIILILTASDLVRGIGIPFKQDVTLNLEQKRRLDKFKERVIHKLPEEYMRKEINLIKWLRSSKYDIDKAESRILEDVQWRKENRMDTIHSEDWSDMWHDFEFKYYTEGRDKGGRSCNGNKFLFYAVKDFDVRRAVISGNGDRLLRYVDKVYDEACSLVRNLGEKYGNMTRGHMLVNLDGYNNVQIGCIRCLPFLIRMVFGYIDHHPECCDKIILVNSPSSIHQLIEIARPLIDEELRKSIFVYGMNKKVWTKALEEDFDFSELSPSIGGTKVYKGLYDDDFDFDKVL